MQLSEQFGPDQARKNFCLLNVLPSENKDYYYYLLLFSEKETRFWKKIIDN